MSFSFINVAACAGVLFLLAAVSIDVACCALGIQYLAGSTHCATGTTQNNFVWWVTVYPALQLLTAATNYKDTVATLLARAACSLVLGAVGAGIAMRAPAGGSGCGARDELLKLYAFGNLGVGSLALCIGAWLSCYCSAPDNEEDEELVASPTTAFTRVVV